MLFVCTPITATDMWQGDSRGERNTRKTLNFLLWGLPDTHAVIVKKVWTKFTPPFQFDHQLTWVPWSLYFEHGLDSANIFTCFFLGFLQRSGLSLESHSILGLPHNLHILRLENWSYFKWRYGPLCGPTSGSCGGLRPSAEASSKKRAVLAHFWRFLVSSSNRGNI